MKLEDLYVVEGDPELGGCDVLKMRQVLELNRMAYKSGERRHLVVLGAAATVEEANAIKRGLVAGRP